MQRRWELAAWYDNLFTLYPGWSYRDVADTPEWLLDLLPLVAQVRQQVTAEGSTGGQ